MNKAKALKWVNLVLLISAVVQVTTGLILALGWFPSALGEISKLHEHNGMLFIVLLFAHLFFNWGWIKSNFFK